MPLEKYRSMRDFDKTPEPAGAVEPESGEPRFVIQEHHATALHWDHRFEHEGVLLSYAVPKGLPPDPRTNHLAVHTEDHPIEYLDFDGEIPDGEYGGGVMKIWDRGTYDLEKMNDRELIVNFHGERASGRYALFQTGGKQWMIHRMDPPEDPTREPLPKPFPPPPVDARKALPRGAGWLYEPSWGGARVNVGIEGGRVAWALDDAGVELDRAFPELARMAEWQDITPMVIEGELVVLGDDGRPDTARLETRRTPDLTRARVLTQAKRHPATVIVNAIVWWDGHPATERHDLPNPKGPSWSAATVTDDGKALLHAVAAQGLPGIRGRRGAEELIAVARVRA